MYYFELLPLVIADSLPFYLSGTNIINQHGRGSRRSERGISLFTMAEEEGISIFIMAEEEGISLL